MFFIQRARFLRRLMLLGMVSFLVCMGPSAFWGTVAIGQENLVRPSAKAERSPAPAIVDPQRPENLPEGINESFLDPNMDPEEFIKRFEVESREVFASRFQIVDALELSPGISIADVGAGTGLFMNAFSKEVGSEGKVYAVEISPSFVKHLRQRAVKENLDNVEVVFCSDRDANLPKDSVDRIFLCDVYHHFEFPQQTLQSLWRALRPGGMLILIDFHREPPEASPERVEWLKGHVRDPMDVFRSEVQQAGFRFKDQVDIEGFKENYFLRFTKE
jgi:ubiquinone/menaquinone biosynthesis C-methylase UbiE